MAKNVRQNPRRKRPAYLLRSLRLLLLYKIAFDDSLGNDFTPKVMMHLLRRWL